MSASTGFDKFYQIFLKEKDEPWTPTDIQVDTDREKALMQKIKNLTNQLEISRFYCDFRDEVLNSPISEQIQRVLGSESNMKMVIYGIGNIESNEGVFPRLQLSLAILMKKDFNWIGDIEVFDPILSATEIRVLESLGFSVLFLNEHGRREAMKPTMFFMPHCDVMLYNNLLQANWKPNLLSNVIIFGNSFDVYFNHSDFSWDDPGKRKLDIWLHMGHMLAAQSFTNELHMRTIPYKDNEIGEGADFHQDCKYAFCSLSWHFFNPSMMWMDLIREKKRMQLMRDEYDGFMRLKDFWGQLKVKLGNVGRPHEKEHWATSKPYWNDESSHTHQKARISTPTSSHYNHHHHILMALGLFASTCIFTKLKHPNLFRKG